MLDNSNKQKEALINIDKIVKSLLPICMECNLCNYTSECAFESYNWNTAVKKAKELIK
ncbi:hypothetical protein MBCUT_06630 [Methanobrevibacter cuticularis]|uniref:Uncharacterized protein n=1 Tax=Methanobrevibacter cuticularis TaxID=47311 RepID=A0A166EGE9_9EURY|nr:hypothetical protein [Methanobrevibacter cuticularis]KZX16625.1 hypothetical protein MBCUT_06630 [Methanobrevibacter cuticularis]